MHALGIILIILVISAAAGVWQKNIHGGGSAALATAVNALLLGGCFYLPWICGPIFAWTLLPSRS
jgi:uncharacterized protein YqgC (DUF456 family)